MEKDNYKVDQPNNHTGYHSYSLKDISDNSIDRTLRTSRHASKSVDWYEQLVDKVEKEEKEEEIYGN